jgi:hypothetical protein
MMLGVEKEMPRSDFSNQGIKGDRAGKALREANILMVVGCRLPASIFTISLFSLTHVYGRLSRVI